MNDIIHFNKLLEKLESLGHLDTDVNADLYALHSSHVISINKRIDELKEHYDHHTLPAIGHKSRSIICLTRILNNQVVSRNIDQETMFHLPEWKNIPPISAHEPIINLLFHAELSDNKITHAKH